MEIELVGSKLSIFGDDRENLTIKVYQNNEEKHNYCMRKAGFYELLKLLREKTGVGIKAKETMSGLRSYHEILVDGMQLEEKIKQGEIVEGEGKQYVNLKQKEVRGKKYGQVIRIYAIKRGEEWRIGLDVHDRNLEKLEIQQGLLVELYANARTIVTKKTSTTEKNNN